MVRSSPCPLPSRPGALPGVASCNPSDHPADPGRRRWLSGAALAAVLGPSVLALRPVTASARDTPDDGPAKGPGAAAGPLHRPVPGSDDTLPVIGLGTWITFNVGQDPAGLQRSVDVMRAFFAGGGRVIDSSPMYGSAQDVVGAGLAQLAREGVPAPVYAADKVWTAPGSRGPGQIATSQDRWGISRFDLLQVHNLLAWEAHLDTLFEMKAQGQLRHVGITTSHGRRHDDIEAIMQRHPIDFVQLTYNPVDRQVEQRLLPLAAERGIGIIVNRPFQQGHLLRRLAGRPLPGWASELGCDTWAQAVLKFIVAHPAVTCVIPATTRVAHVQENLRAGHGPLPEAALRECIAAGLAAL